VKETTIALSSDHMLILYELVVRLNADEHLQFADQAEQRVLWDLESELERKVAAVLAPDYQAQLASARQRVRAPELDKRCADLRKRKSLTSGTALGGRRKFDASKVRCAPSRRQRAAGQATAVPPVWLPGTCALSGSTTTDMVGYLGTYSAYVEPSGLPWSLGCEQYDRRFARRAPSATAPLSCTDHQLSA
jgi:hypothetical protein